MTFFDIVDGQSLPGGSNQAVMENGTLKIGTLHELSVLEDHISSVLTLLAVAGDLDFSEDKTAHN